MSSLLLNEFEPKDFGSASGNNARDGIRGSAGSVWHDHMNWAFWKFSAAAAAAKRQSSVVSANRHRFTIDLPLHSIPDLWRSFWEAVFLNCCLGAKPSSFGPPTDRLARLCVKIHRSSQNFCSKRYPRKHGANWE
jgi:hypothetical protein